MTQARTAAVKHSQSRALHYAQARQDWRHSSPYLELDDETLEPGDTIPSPCPIGRRIEGDAGLVERRGVVVAVPSPFIDSVTNRRAAAFWRSKGFEKRTAYDSPHLVEGYVVEWVRFCDVPLKGETFTPQAWLEAATRKHEELYYE